MAKAPSQAYVRQKRSNRKTAEQLAQKGVPVLLTVRDSEAKVTVTSANGKPLDIVMMLGNALCATTNALYAQGSMAEREVVLDSIVILAARLRLGPLADAENDFESLLMGDDGVFATANVEKVFADSNAATAAFFDKRPPKGKAH